MGPDKVGPKGFDRLDDRLFYRPHIGQHRARAEVGNQLAHRRFDRPDRRTQHHQVGFGQQRPFTTRPISNAQLDRPGRRFRSPRHPKNLVTTGAQRQPQRATNQPQANHTNLHSSPVPEQ